MDLKKLLPTRRELIRDVSIGVAVAGAVGFGAAKLFPSEATSSGSGSSSGVATDAEIEAITDNGAITLGPLGSRNLGTSHRLLSGESVTFEAPSSKGDRYHDRPNPRQYFRWRLWISCYPEGLRFVFARTGLSTRSERDGVFARRYVGSLHDPQPHQRIPAFYVVAGCPP